MRLIAIDTNTTGFDPKKGDRIVEIGAIEIVNGQMIENKTFHKFVDPQRDIPEIVTSIHGVGACLLKKENAKPFLVNENEFLDFIKGATLIAHNAPFNLAFIINELAIARLSSVGDMIDTLTSTRLYDIGDMDVVDTLALAQEKYPHQRNTLEAICDHLKVDCNQWQDSGSLRNAILTAQAYLAMIKDGVEPCYVKKVRELYGDKYESLKTPQSAHHLIDAHSNQKSISQLAADVYQNFQDIYNQKITKGLMTGFSDLDEMTYGLNKGQLITIGGRPSMGKTLFTMNIVRNIALRNHNKPSIAFFSLERCAQNMLALLMATEAKVELGKMRTARFTHSDWRELANASGKLSASNIHLNDSNRSIQYIVDQSRIFKKMPSGLDLIIIDYIQLIERDNIPLKKIPSVLKSLAIELDLPIIVLSQLDRRLENRADKRPKIRDISSFIELELCSDILMLLYRDEVYNKKPSNEGCAEIILGKNINGCTGTLQLNFIASHGYFESKKGRFPFSDQ